MNLIKLGIIREGKVPVDGRVPITPGQARFVQEQFPQVQVLVQTSEIRCFADKDYAEDGIQIIEDISNCDVILGVKEVQTSELIENKTFFFFSHTTKKQEYNRDLLRSILHKKIRLIDYELLTDSIGTRIIAFGRYAGIVGAYNGILTFGHRYNLFRLRRAHQCFDLEDLKTEFSKVNLPAVKIAVTGGGRVAKGVMEVLYAMNIRHVSPAKYLDDLYQEPVFTQLNSRDYHLHKQGQDFNRSEFFEKPQNYSSKFDKFAQVTDILIAAAYWDPDAPVLFNVHDILQRDFSIKVIADITCDIEGSIPATKKSTTIEDPVYDFNPSENIIEPAFSDEANITVMAIDNLPGELPRNASQDFGEQLISQVLPNLLDDDKSGVLERATITRDGRLTESYNYLQDYVDGKE